MSDTPPYSEATVAMLAQVIDDERGCFPEVMAAYVLGALDAAGRLLPEGAEQRDEAGVEHTYRDGEPIVLLAASKEAAERTVKAGNERGYAQHRLMQRTSWSTGWSAVPPEPKEGAGGQPSPA